MGGKKQETGLRIFWRNFWFRS